MYSRNGKLKITKCMLINKFNSKNWAVNYKKNIRKKYLIGQLNNYWAEIWLNG